MEKKLIYVTVSNRAEAEKIAKATVGERLAACANIFDGITSVFYWEEKLCTGPEAALILKTTESCTGALTARIKELHSYACPCITVLPIQGGNADFLNWIEQNTRGQNP